MKNIVIVLTATCLALAILVVRVAIDATNAQAATDVVRSSLLECERRWFQPGDERPLERKYSTSYPDNWTCRQRQTYRPCSREAAFRMLADGGWVADDSDLIAMCPTNMLHWECNAP